MSVNRGRLETARTLAGGSKEKYRTAAPNATAIATKRAGVRPADLDKLRIMAQREDGNEKRGREMAAPFGVNS